MSISSLTYLPPVQRRIDAADLDYELIDAATELHDAGSFLESVNKVFAHVLPEETIDLAAGVAFTQGSSRVLARIDDGILSVSVPLVRLPPGGAAIAALRYVLASINGSGQLYQGRLRGDDLHIEMSERLSALHPQKLLEVLRRMPVDADRHDDWMIGQFGAAPLDRAAIEPLDPGEQKRAVAIWRTHWAEVEELLKEAQRKRSMFFLAELTSYAICRLRFELPLAGTILPRLLESADTFNDCHVDPMKREATLARCVKEMKAITDEELVRNLGHATHAISPVATGSPGRISGFFAPGDYMEAIDKYRTGSMAMDAALAVTATYYYLLATHAWPDEIVAELEAGLLAASGKPWREAANGLFAHAKMVADKYGGDDDEEEDEDEDGDDDENEEDGQ